jgi:hypothetical protein
MSSSLPLKETRWNSRRLARMSNSIVSTALLVEEAMKITLGQQLQVLTPHQVRDT